MVEFAIAASLLLLVLFGVIDYGRFMYTAHAMSNAARAGSRWAIVHGSKSSSPADSGAIQTYVRGLNIPLVDPTAITVTATWPAANGKTAWTANQLCPNPPAGTVGTQNAPGQPVCVQVTYTFNYGILRLPAQTLTGISQMVISN